ncbi:disintegrin and metalloproteinase domain-containing protein 10 [Patella vulgata]|uniref:disintegrin and metalloproteinase domain-containing protein 10 n=1 Tax=Patella vulgata TaxID=6465 RepID=UPI0024A9A583|nr:disintegrin and metalloproteinase domain-containing protein 10 [Patella vulgata]
MQEIQLREYFLFHPTMNIQINDNTLKENQLDDMPKFYFGNGKPSENKTSFLGRLHDRYFNGTFYHGRQISFFNCIHDKNLRKQRSTQLKYICLVIQDEDVEEKIKMLQSQSNDCGSQNPIHVHMQNKATILNRQFIHKSQERRKKRSVNSITCVLHLMADHTFYKHIGGENIAVTVSEMVASVMEADVIFRGTDFSGNGQGDNIGFVVGNITIYSSESDPGNKFSDSINVYEYLDLMTEYDLSQYCLGIGFTCREFSKGVVGLAWVASSSRYGPVGGICQGKVKISQNKYRSYNTALVTYLNYGSVIPSQKSALTLTHELGHSFGSSHDPSSNPTCSPGGLYGSYIMDPYTNSGEKPNHRKFSLCSVNSIYPVVVRKGYCLKTYSGPICGNSVMEGNEECDCGTAGTCSYNDDCCTPVDPPIGSTDKACTIRRSEGKVCSPVSSPCCDKSCQLIQQAKHQVCKLPTECSMASYCNGTFSNCPSPEFMPDGLLCNGGRKTCLKGQCSSSICKKKGLIECQCINNDEHLCQVCCKNDNITNCECLPASQYGLTQVNGDILTKKRGEPCNNFNGFCDNNVCVSDEEDSIHSRMKLIFSDQNIKDIWYWFENFWYYILMVFFLLILTGGIYRATYQKIRHIDIDTEACRYGKLLSICQGADTHVQYFKEQIQILSQQFNDKILEVELNKETISPVIAISRLQLLFPDVNISELFQVVNSSSSEEFAVKMLLIKGYSMKKYSIKKNDDISSKLNLSRQIDSQTATKSSDHLFNNDVTLVDI